MAKREAMKSFADYMKNHNIPIVIILNKCLTSGRYEELPQMGDFDGRFLKYAQKE